MLGAKEAGHEFGETAAIGKIGEPEMSPGVDSPVSIAIIDHLDGSAVRVGVVHVKLGCPAQGRQHVLVVAVLKISCQRRKGQVVIASRWTGSAVLAPISIGSLFDQRIT